jgi:crotonobetainyl-CoA:carnitine CoA-transferase CaiB-like acyl-CoA transferase
MARFSVTQGTLRRDAPLIGENTAEVLAELEVIEQSRHHQQPKDSTDEPSAH